MAGRGQLTKFVIMMGKKEGLGTLTHEQLRLLPYLQYCLMNNRRIDPERINQTERSILSDWRAKGWIEGGASMDSLRCTWEFWISINKILYISYVNYDRENDND